MVCGESQRSSSRWVEVKRVSGECVPILFQDLFLFVYLYECGSSPHVCVCTCISASVFVLFWAKYYKTQTPVSVLLIRMLFAFAFCGQSETDATWVGWENWGGVENRGGGKSEMGKWVCVRATCMKNILELGLSAAKGGKVNAKSKISRNFGRGFRGC